MWWALGAAVVLVTTNIIVIVRNRRWLRRVEQASGDPDALMRLIYGPRRGRR